MEIVVLVMQAATALVIAYGAVLCCGPRLRLVDERPARQGGNIRQLRLIAEAA